jgi:hypothetical protein
MERLSRPRQDTVWLMLCCFIINIEHQNFELRLPRPKSEKETPAVLTMEECLRF